MTMGMAKLHVSNGTYNMYYMYTQLHKAYKTYKSTDLQRVLSAYGKLVVLKVRHYEHGVVLVPQASVDWDHIISTPGGGGGGGGGGERD